MHAISLPIISCAASLAMWGLQSMAYLRHFHHKYLTKTFSFSLIFHVNWYKLTSKPSEANSGTYANIDQGFILNLGLNHMQYAVFTSNQRKNVWFVPLTRNMNCTITYTYIHKNYPVYDKYIHGLKTNILEQIIHVFRKCWCAILLSKNCCKTYIVFYTFHLQKYINSCDYFNKKYVDVIWLSPKCTQCELRQLY